MNCLSLSTLSADLWTLTPEERDDYQTDKNDQLSVGTLSDSILSCIPTSHHSLFQFLLVGDLSAISVLIRKWEADK